MSTCKQLERGCLLGGNSTFLMNKHNEYPNMTKTLSKIVAFIE